MLFRRRFAPRFYVAAMTDGMSLQKAKVFEEGLDRQGKVVGLGWSSLFYIESTARVRRLSLSGLLLYKLHMVDHFLCNGHSYRRPTPECTMLVVSCKVYIITDIAAAGSLLWFYYWSPMVGM